MFKYRNDLLRFEMDSDGCTRPQRLMYMDLLVAYQHNGGPLPRDQRHILTLLGAPVADLPTLEVVLGLFFIDTPAGWRHALMQQRIEHEQRVSEKRREAALARHRQDQLQRMKQARRHANAQPAPVDNVEHANAPTSPMQMHKTPEKPSNHAACSPADANAHNPSVQMHAQRARLIKSKPEKQKNNNNINNLHNSANAETTTTLTGREDSGDHGPASAAGRIRTDYSSPDYTLDDAYREIAEWVASMSAGPDDRGSGAASAADMRPLAGFSMH